MDTWGTPTEGVMPALFAGIRVFLRPGKKDVGGRDEPGHDSEGGASVRAVPAARMTTRAPGAAKYAAMTARAQRCAQPPWFTDIDARGLPPGVA